MYNSCPAHLLQAAVNAAQMLNNQHLLQANSRQCPAVVRWPFSSPPVGPSWWSSPQTAALSSQSRPSWHHGCHTLTGSSRPETGDLLTCTHRQAHTHTGTDTHKFARGNVFGYPWFLNLISMGGDKPLKLILHGLLAFTNFLL